MAMQQERTDDHRVIKDAPTPSVHELTQMSVRSGRGLQKQSQERSPHDANKKLLGNDVSQQQRSQMGSQMKANSRASYSSKTSPVPTRQVRNNGGA